MQRGGLLPQAGARQLTWEVAAQVHAQRLLVFRAHAALHVICCGHLPQVVILSKLEAVLVAWKPVDIAVVVLQQEHGEAVGRKVLAVGGINLKPAHHLPLHFEQRLQAGRQEEGGAGQYNK